MADVIVEARNRLGVWRQGISSGTLRVEKYDLNLLERLAVQCEELRQLVDDSKRTQTVLKRKVSLHDQEMAGLKTEVKAANTDRDAAIGRMQSDLDSALSELGTLREQIANNINPELEDLRRERADLIEERRGLKQQIVDAHKKLTAGRAGEAELRDDWLAIKAERDEMKEKLERTENELALLKNSTKGQSDVISNQVQEIERLQKFRQTLIESLPGLLVTTLEKVNASSEHPDRELIESELGIALRGLKESGD